MVVVLRKRDVPSDIMKRFEKVRKEGKRKVNVKVVPFEIYQRGRSLDELCSNEEPMDDSPYTYYVLQVYDRQTGKGDYSKIFKEGDVGIVDDLIDVASAYSNVKAIGIPMCIRKGPLASPNYSRIHLFILTYGQQVYASRAVNTSSERLKDMGLNPEKPISENLISLLTEKGYKKKKERGSFPFFYNEENSEIEFSVLTERDLAESIRNMREIQSKFDMMDIATEPYRRANNRIMRNFW